MKFIVDMNLSPRWVMTLEDAGSQVISALRQMSFELKAGALITVEPLRYRLSMLPLQRR